MKLKHYKASRKSGLHTQIAECLEIGSLTICRETTDKRLHLLYQQDISALLEHGEYETQVEELDIPALDENFSELQCDVYYGPSCEIYLFDGLAVKANLDGIEYFEQSKLKPEDLERIWGGLSIDWKEPYQRIRVPAGQAGRLAIQIEQLQYEVWDTLYRAPGETTETEERLEGVQMLCDAFRHPKSIHQVLNTLKQTLVDELDELSSDLDTMSPERRNYASGRIDDIRGLLEKVDNACREYSDFANSTMTEQAEA